MTGIHERTKRIMREQAERQDVAGKWDRVANIAIAAVLLTLAALAAGYAAWLCISEIAS